MQIESRWLKALVLAGGLGALAVGAKVSNAQVLNFDDLPQPAVGALVELPNPYHGFVATEIGMPAGSTTPSPLALEGNDDYEGPSSSYLNDYGAPSAPNAVYNDLGDGVTLTKADSSTFTFGGSDISSFANGSRNGQVYAIDSAKFLTITGMLGNVTEFSTTVPLSNSQYTLFTPTYFGPLTSVTFSGSGSGEDNNPNYPLPNDFFLLDNVGVPEPGSMALVGIGALFLTTRRRRHGAVRL